MTLSLVCESYKYSEATIDLSHRSFDKEDQQPVWLTARMGTLLRVEIKTQKERKRIGQNVVPQSERCSKTNTSNNNTTLIKTRHHKPHHHQE